MRLNRRIFFKILYKFTLSIFTFINRVPSNFSSLKMILGGKRKNNMWVREVSLNMGDNYNAFEKEFSGLNKMPDLVLLFGNSDEIESSNELRKINERFSDSLVVGCSTGTNITGKKTFDSGISGIAMGFDNSTIRHSCARIEDSIQSYELGAKLGLDLDADDLVAVFVMCDGLFINGSEIIKGIAAVLGDNIPISGGLAGDGESFTKTRLLIGTEIFDHGAIAIGFYSKSLQVSHASYGGWFEFGPEWKITKSKGNVVSEIDEMPAIELYDDYVGSEKMALQASALLYPLKVWPPKHPEKGVVRAIMNVDRENGTLTFAGDVPEGWNAKLMHGNMPGLIDGATQAANHAISNLKAANENNSPDLCLVVSCVARRILLGSRTAQEIEALSSIIGENIPLAGFYSYGEISPQNDSPVAGLHNQTMTITLMKEDAA